MLPPCDLVQQSEDQKKYVLSLGEQEKNIRNLQREARTAEKCGKEGEEEARSLKEDCGILCISSEGPTTELGLGLNKDSLNGGKAISCLLCNGLESSHVSTNYKAIGWQVNELTRGSADDLETRCQRAKNWSKQNPVTSKNFALPVYFSRGLNFLLRLI